MKTSKTALDNNYSLAYFWQLLHIPIKEINHVTRFLYIPQTSRNIDIVSMVFKV